MTISSKEPMSPPTPSPNPSPLRSSPLSNPPIYSHRRIPSPSQAQPIPRRISQPTRSRPVVTPITPSASASSSSSSAAMPVPTPSPPLSRSHPLLGSYPLSLIHSRMSHAHQPHSSSTTFSIHVKAVGQGKRCPPELKCPKPLNLPFSATYYDLEDQGRAGGSSQTPWVGTIDLEQYYYDQYASLSTITPTMEGDPPDHPGYHVAPVGQLQMIVKTPTNAIKAFLVPYDLRDLPIGGRLLARERTYVHSTSTPAHSAPNSPDPGSASPQMDKGKKKECLRYAYQLQFICLTCLTSPPTSTHKSTQRHRDSSTTRHTSSAPHSEVNKSYYLSKTLKVVFTSTPPESDEGLRTERADEIVPPSSSGIRISNTVKQRRRSSGVGAGVFGASSSPSRTREEWELVRLKWMARRDMNEIHRSREAVSQARVEDDDPAVQQGQSRTRAGDSAPIAVLPPFKPPTRAPTPIPQPFNLPTNAQTVRPPPSPRFQRRHLRRTSAEERELSEKLRTMGME